MSAKPQWSGSPKGTASESVSFRALDGSAYIGGEAGQTRGAEVKCSG